MARFRNSGVYFVDSKKSWNLQSFALKFYESNIFVSCSFFLNCKYLLMYPYVQFTDRYRFKETNS